MAAGAERRQGESVALCGRWQGFRLRLLGREAWALIVVLRADDARVGGLRLAEVARVRRDDCPNDNGIRSRGFRLKISPDSTIRVSWQTQSLLESACKRTRAAESCQAIPLSPRQNAGTVPLPIGACDARAGCCHWWSRRSKFSPAELKLTAKRRQSRNSQLQYGCRYKMPVCLYN
jgi:hypothetical protein